MPAPAQEVNQLVSVDDSDMAGDEAGDGGGGEVAGTLVQKRGRITVEMGMAGASVKIKWIMRVEMGAAAALVVGCKSSESSARSIILVISIPMMLMLGVRRAGDDSCNPSEGSHSDSDRDSGVGWIHRIVKTPQSLARLQQRRRHRG